MVLRTFLSRYNGVWQNLAVKLQALPDIFRIFFFTKVVSIDLRNPQFYGSKNGGIVIVDEVV